MRVIWVASLGLMIGSLQAVASAAEPSRGQLLYDAHCVECHDTQVHWRDGRTATDWRGLKAQVRRWQARALLDWSEADVVLVARYLNERIYRFAQTDDQVSLVPRPRPAD